MAFFWGICAGAAGVGRGGVLAHTECPSATTHTHLTGLRDGGAASKTELREWGSCSARRPRA